VLHALCLGLLRRALVSILVTVQLKRNLTLDRPVAVIVRRPLSNRTTSANTGAPLPAASVPKPPSAKLVPPAPLPYKSGFGFVPRGALRTPKERGRLHEERLAFHRRARASQCRDLPKFKIRDAPIITYGTRYTREYVSERTGFYRIISSPALLAPPATNYCGQVLQPDMFTVVPGICEHAPPQWDKWCATPRPEYNSKIDRSMLFVPTTTPSGDFYAEDMARFFPFLWRKILAEHKREVRLEKKKRLSRARAFGGRRRL
jgi:hypothetical protein